MRFKLEDNTQEAFQFLLLGAAIVLGIRLLITGLGLWMESGVKDELITAISAYRNDFLLRDTRTIVVGDMDMFGRLALAFLVSLITGVAGSAIGAAYAQARKKPGIPAAVHGARFGIAIAMALLVYSALFLPPRAVRILDEGALILERPSLFNALSLPVPATEHLIPWPHVHRVSQRSRAAGMQGCGVHEEVVLHTENGGHVIAMSIPSGADCARAVGQAKESARQLVMALDDHMLTTN